MRTTGGIRGLHLQSRDEDGWFQDAALRMGYRPTQYKDYTSVFEMDKNRLEFELPEGFVVDCSAGWKFRRLMRYVAG